MRRRRAISWRCSACSTRSTGRPRKGATYCCDPHPQPTPQRRRLVVLVVLGAIALTASYPPFPLPFLSFFAITPAVLLIRQAVTDANPRSAFRWGWWYGLVSNALV